MSESEFAGYRAKMEIQLSKERKAKQKQFNGDLDAYQRSLKEHRNKTTSWDAEASANYEVAPGRDYYNWQLANPPKTVEDK